MRFLDSSGLTSIDTTQRVASLPRAAGLSWPPKFQARASTGDGTSSTNAQSRQPTGQSSPQTTASTQGGLTPRPNAAFLAQSLSQEGASGTAATETSAYQAAATAYGRLATATPQQDGSVEVLAGATQSVSSKPVDLTV